MRFAFQSLAEEQPGPLWAESFRRNWPAYRRWFLSEGIGARPTYLECRRALTRHMPELLPAWQAACAAAGGGDLEARFLSLWRPPAYIAACSQAIRPGAAPLLVRNYDYAPAAFEGLLLRSRWLGNAVMGMSDCLMGLLDGVNQDGLAVSLTFGGRRTVGEGFGVPLVLRYVLETCATTADAVAALTRVPCHMAYNVTVVDAQARHATLFLAPDRAAVVTSLPAATNHQDRIEWLRHARATASVQRERFLYDELLGGQLPAEGDFIAAFLRPPLYAHAFARGFGTLYTAAYRPLERSLTLLWPDATRDYRLDDFRSEAWGVTYPMAA
jgi:predicted choloylglycine hydrolase